MLLSLMFVLLLLVVVMMMVMVVTCFRGTCVCKTTQKAAKVNV